jgi:hypothetical protein
MSFEVRKWRCVREGNAETEMRYFWEKRCGSKSQFEEVTHRASMLRVDEGFFHYY